MRQFIKYASIQKTLEECGQRGIKNKNGKPFLRHSLITLLANKKYVGQWELNPANKNKNQNKLLPYERYQFVDLPHGCVIDMGLWNQVQEVLKRIAGNRDKNTQIKRIYPLAGLLKYHDQTSFGGTGAWGKTTRSNYYYNKKNKIRISAEIIENQVKTVIAKLVSDSPELKESIQRRKVEVNSP